MKSPNVHTALETQTKISVLMIIIGFYFFLMSEYKPDHV